MTEFPSPCSPYARRKTLGCHHQRSLQHSRSVLRILCNPSSGCRQTPLLLPLSSRFDDISDGMGQTRTTLPKSVSTQRRITNKRERLGELAGEAVGGKRRTVALPPSRSHFFMDLYPCSAEPLRSILGDIDILMARAWSFSGRMDALARHAIISDCNKRTQNTRG